MFEQMANLEPRNVRVGTIRSGVTSATASNPAAPNDRVLDTGHVSTDAEQALRRAEAHQRRVGFGDRAASIAVLAAERALAKARGEPYADTVDLGVWWSAGAPIPHVVSNGSRAILLCYAGEVDPDWDGTYMTVVSAADSAEVTFVEIVFESCASIRFGAPNDEALGGHPLSGRGLDGYGAHVVHNSTWLEEHIRINSVHEQHNEHGWRTLTHYFLVFHDEMFEALAGTVAARLVQGTMSSLLAHAAERLTLA